MIHLAAPVADALDALQEKLGEFLANHLLLNRNTEGLSFDKFAMHDVIEKWRIPRGANPSLGIANIAERYGYHVQILYDGRPAFYAVVFHANPAWRIKRIYQSGKAIWVKNGINRLFGQRQQQYEGRVRLLDASIYEFSSFWVKETDQHFLLRPGLRSGFWDWYSGQQVVKEMIMDDAIRRAQGGIRPRIVVPDGGDLSMPTR